MATLPTTLPVLNSVVDQTKTKYANTFERPIAPGVAEVIDGMALVGDYTDPTDEKATPSTGSGSETFLGVAIVGVVNVRQLPLVEEDVAPVVSPAAAVTFTLKRTPKSPAVAAPGTATVVAYDITSGSPVLLSQGSPGAANSVYTVSGDQMTVGGSLMGHTIRTILTYEPTVNEVLARFHQGPINYDNTAQLLEQVSIGGGVGSEIWTNFYDTLNGQFTNGGDVKLGGAGRFTAGGSGNTVGKVVHAPSAEDSTVGFRVTV